MNASNGRPSGRRMNEVATDPAKASAGPASAPASGWKVGREFLPFHPDATHVPPEYRDGWNACYQAALDSVGRALPPAGVVGWLNVDGERILTAKQKQSMEQHQGAAGKSAAREYTVPLVPGSLPAESIEQLLHRLESAIRYAEATVAPGNTTDRQGEWARVHAGRANSSHTQLWLALRELAQLRGLLAADPAAPVPEGCTRLQVVTRHPQDYVLANEEDGSKWRGTEEGKWTRA